MNVTGLSKLTPADIKNIVKKIDRKTWIKIGVGILSILLAGFFILYPAWVVRLQIRGQIREIEGQIETTQNLLKRQPVLVNEKEQFLKFNTEAKTHLYQEGETGLLLGEVSKLAQESNVAIVASTPKQFESVFPPPFDGQYGGSFYQFTAEGGYHELALFISRIESYPKLLRIQSFNLNHEEDTAKHIAVLGLSVVSVKKNPAPPPAVPAKQRKK